MIQEQISNFLGVKSFKRKYPDIRRRPVDLEERAYLVDSGLVSEALCDLGIVLTFFVARLPNSTPGILSSFLATGKQNSCDFLKKYIYIVFPLMLVSHESDLL